MVKCDNRHDVDQQCQLCSSLSGDCTFGVSVCQLLYCVDVFSLDLNGCGRRANPNRHGVMCDALRDFLVCFSVIEDARRWEEDLCERIVLGQGAKVLRTGE